MNNFIIQNKNQLLDILSTTEQELSQILVSKNSYYTRYYIAKKNGNRTIYGLKNQSSLYKLQKSLQKKIFENILYPDCVYGFCKNKSYFDFLIPHINEHESFYLRLDISNFFESIRTEDAKKALQYYISNEMSDEEHNEIQKILLDVTTIDGKFPQGAITSPLISNLVFRSLDIRIEKYCEKLKVTYTRYADDLLFSSSTDYIHSYKFISMIENILRCKHFYLNYSKTLKYKGEMSINGYVIGPKIRLSRKKLHELNELIYKLRKTPYHSISMNDTLFFTHNKLAGYRSFLIQYLKYTNDDKYAEYILKKIHTIEHLLLTRYNF